MQLASITSGLNLVGVEPGLVVSVVTASAVGPDSYKLVYQRPAGGYRDRLICQADADAFSVAVAERPWAFDGNGEDFKLAVEAKRIDLAFLFDPMMAVHTSSVQPLPHQIAAVYESMLPRQPLRYVLADDPGAGKTIMAGLYIRELLMRADARRVLVISPGSLTDQWRDELYEKFGLEFQVFSKELLAAHPNGNPFESLHQVIVRLDQMSRNEDLQNQLCAESWDLVVFDEAHKLSAHYAGSEIKRTDRYKFAERIGAHTRHLLLMTATPHNGKEEDFQLFLALLDSDRFYGKFRDGAHKVDCSDLMRRMVKEDLVKFDGKPLFPERRAYTVNYTLSPLEAVLYHDVTDYVKTEMGKADQLDGRRKGSVGFALTALQRRLASSPEAIFQSLKRRRERLEKRLREEQLGQRGKAYAETLLDVPEDEDDLSAEEQENLEENLVDTATAAQSIAELQGEIHLLGKLVEQAKTLVSSKQDRKWDELSKILQKEGPETRDRDGRLRKLIVFTEHKDTLNYLRQQIIGVLGSEDAVVVIHGGTHRDDRKKAQELFRSDLAVRVLLATDAAGEGVNLQTANLMVNYDLPWNPNRLEQRFGRIHRIGQVEVCHLWNLVAKETREGDVYHRLLKKLEVEGIALKGRVFDILGEVFEDISLKDLLMEAVRYGDSPETRERMWMQKADRLLEHENLLSVMNRNALAQEFMSPERIFAVKEEMEKAEARKLQPYFIRSYFLRAFETLGGSIYPREQGRWEVTFVPGALRERDRLITGRNRREQVPVLKRYERVCFSKDSLSPPQAGGARAVLLHPGHPLMLAVSDVVLEKHANLLRQGATLLDSADEGTEPSVIFLLSHEVKSGDDTVLSKRIQFIRVKPDGSATFAGWAPHLDLEPVAEADAAHVEKLRQADWLAGDIEKQAIALASAALVPDHFKEVYERRTSHVDKTLVAVHERLTKEINYWTDRLVKLRDDRDAGKDVRLNLQNTERTLNDLESRLENRKKDLESMRHVTNSPPLVIGATFVVPVGAVRQLRGDTLPAAFCADAAARSRIEWLAMAAVRKVEEAKGHRVVDVSAQKCGWDLTSYPPASEGRQPEARHIEVKGRSKGADTITITRNEILYALNQADKFVLAIVLVEEDDSVNGPHYIHRPFDVEPAFGVSSQNFELSALMRRAERP